MYEDRKEHYLQMLQASRNSQRWERRKGRLIIIASIVALSVIYYNFMM